MASLRTTLFAALLAAAPCAEGTAFGLCTPPRALADPPRLHAAYAQPPSAPGCLRGFGRSAADCDAWELQSYRQGVRRYLQELERFAVRARQHARDAELFAREAEAYLRCETHELGLP